MQGWDRVLHRIKRNESQISTFNPPLLTVKTSVTDYLPALLSHQQVLQDVTNTKVQKWASLESALDVSMIGEFLNLSINPWELLELQP